MKENYPKAYTEVLEIMKYMPKGDVNKIPKEMIEMFENKRDKSYVFNVKEIDDFADLNILDETEAIFVNIFRDYWATDLEREEIEEKEKQVKELVEEEKFGLEDLEKLFEINEPKNEEESYTSVVVKEEKETFFSKILNKIKKIFNR